VAADHGLAPRKGQAEIRPLLLGEDDQFNGMAQPDVVFDDGSYRFQGADGSGETVKFPPV